MNDFRNRDGLLVLHCIDSIRKYLYARPTNRVSVPAGVLSSEHTPVECKSAADMVDIVGIELDTYLCTDRPGPRVELCGDEWRRIVLYLREAPAVEFPDKFSNRMVEINDIAAKVFSLNACSPDWRDYDSSIGLIDSMPADDVHVVTCDDMELVEKTIRVLSDYVEAHRTDDTLAPVLFDSACARLAMAKSWKARLGKPGNRISGWQATAVVEFANTVEKGGYEA